MSPQSTGKRWTTEGSSGHRPLIESAGGWTYSLLTSGVERGEVEFESPGRGVATDQAEAAAAVSEALDKLSRQRT